MGFRSVVFGHIHTLDNQTYDANRDALRAFQYDDFYPFPNIFRLETPPRYKAPSILFGGTFKQLEDDWLSWFDRFVTLLSTLEATEANVILDCWLGRYAWTLGLQSAAEGVPVSKTLKQQGTLTGQTWCIVQAPIIPADVRDLLHPAGISVRINPSHVYGY